MKKEFRDKDNVFIHFYKSCKYSLSGLFTSIKTERSLHLLLLACAFVIVMCLILEVSVQDIIIISMLAVFLFSMELMNTAIEHTVDMVTKEYHPLAKKAKDCGSAASFVIAVLAIIVVVYIFLSYII